MFRRKVRLLIGLLLGMTVSSFASAQSAITGVVSDTSGAVMPGVSVEVSSPALIEQVRNAVTDSSGAYKVNVTCGLAPHLQSHVYAGRVQHVHP